MDRRDDPATTTLVLGGELDLATTPSLRAALTPLEADGVHLLLDVSRLSLLDSSGVGELLRAYRRAQENGHRLDIRVGDGLARRRLRQFGLEGHLPVVP